MSKRVAIRVSRLLDFTMQIAALTGVVVWIFRDDLHRIYIHIEEKMFKLTLLEILIEK